MRGLDELPPPRALTALNDPAILRGAGVLTGLEALSVGLNWILAPVADLDLEPENPIVQTRAFGSDPARVADLVAGWVAGCQASGALACVKHFPGHGGVVADSHHELPVDSRPLEVLRAVVDELKRRFHITHTTVQVEVEGCEGNDMYCIAERSHHHTHVH